ncbi:MAG: MOSC domain-containing protein [Alphaproteobacteria bacterium]|nr:MOSC domain-containing protein [Alphaproteobacteria bacterium]
MSATVAAIHRYPVKGLSHQPLDRVALKAGEMLPCDRAYALALGSTVFDPNQPEWMPKTNFLMLQRDEKLAALKTAFDPATQTLTVHRGGRQVARGRLDEAMGRAVIEQFFAAYMGEAARGQPKLVAAPGHNFSDYRQKVVSIINLASVKDLERVVGAPVDPLRFRGNLLVEGLPPWQEFQWIGKEFRIGDVPVRTVKRIQRCAATAVNPATATRDINVVQSLVRGYGHPDLGIYVAVLAEGAIAPGATVTPPA